MQKQSTIFDDNALQLRSDDIVAAWDAGHITGDELRVLAALFFDEFAEDYLADMHGCGTDEISKILCADEVAPPFLAIPVVRLAADLELLLAHAAECRTAEKVEVDPDDFSDDMFARHDDLSRIIHAHCDNEEINRNYPLYVARCYRLIQRAMSVLIFAGGDAKAFAEAIADAQSRAREEWARSGNEPDTLVTKPNGGPISLPLFDIGELILRNTDIVAAWDQGLMTWPELRVLAELFYAENAAFVLVKACGSDADEIHYLWNSKGLADPFLGVPLARFAESVGQIVAFADEHSELERQHRMGQSGEAEVVAFQQRHGTGIEAIAYAPLACDELYDDQSKYVASLNSLYPPIWARALEIGYQAGDFQAVIAKAQRGDL